MSSDPDSPQSGIVLGLETATAAISSEHGATLRGNQVSHVRCDPGANGAAQLILQQGFRTQVTEHMDPTVVWRLRRDRARAHATIIPGTPHTTVAWFFDGTMDRAENYDSLELALARAEHIRGMLLRDGWTEEQ
jgi:hypothetical protein